MTKTAVIGMQWGDEAKAKMIGWYLRNGGYNVCARYGGGSNAGHTQIDDSGRMVITHLIPAGIIALGVYNLILADVMVNPLEAVEEIKALQGMGYKVGPPNLGISSRVQMTLQYHLDFEADSEKKKGSNAVGTTMKGIGPTAVSKYGREGIRLAEFLDPGSFERFLGGLSRKRGNIVAGGVQVRKYMEMYGSAMEFLRPFMVDEAEILMQRKNENWVYEGAQGTLLDVVYGTIPYVTSSMPSSPPSDTGERVGVAKAYITRVGGGPMPTRMLPEEEQKVRGVKGETPGAEFGATTGRPRGCGWFDVVAARYAASIARIGKWDVTKLDRLTGFPRIKVAVAYRRKGSEIKMKSFPADRFVLEEIEPVYDELPGWEDDITQAKGPADLPQNARDYVKRIQDMVGCEISHVSFGPRAEQTITVE